MAESSTIFWVFGMTQPGIEPRSLGPLANTLLIIPMGRLRTNIILIIIIIITAGLTTSDYTSQLTFLLTGLEYLRLNTF